MYKMSERLESISCDKSLDSTIWSKRNYLALYKVKDTKEWDKARSNIGSSLTYLLSELTASDIIRFSLTYMPTQKSDVIPQQSMTCYLFWLAKAKGPKRTGLPQFLSHIWHDCIMDIWPGLYLSILMINPQSHLPFWQGFHAHLLWWVVMAISIFSKGQESLGSNFLQKITIFFHWFLV